MGVRRYSRDPSERQREEHADHLRRECNVGWSDPVTIGDLIEAGYRQAEWHCRRGGCYHHSQPVDLSKYGRKASVYQLRWHYVCDKCGMKGPKLYPLWES